MNKTQKSNMRASRIQVPFVDLELEHESIKEEIHNAIQRVIETHSFTLGEEVWSFERQFAAFCGAKYGVGVGSGTSALHLALLAAGVKEGDEAITVPNTFIATAEAISMCGAHPVFVDINEQTYNIDVAQAEDKITDKTKAIVPVHLYGQPADMDAVMSLAKRYDLKVIEDACQAHGARYKGKTVGSFGDAGCFSFYPSKNLGAYGDGGMVVTNNADIAEAVSLLRNHGQKDKYTHITSGFCTRLHGIQAAVLGIKLRYLPLWNSLRREKARAYTETLSGTSVITPFSESSVYHVYHLYIIRTKKRDELRQSLAMIGIETGIHYPIPLHLQPAFWHLGYKRGDFPVTEKVAAEILSLPMFPEITYREIEEIVNEIKKRLH